MKKCVIWGIGAEYDQYYNQIKLQVVTKKMSILAYISKDIYCSTLDGKKVHSPEDLNKLDIDYVIVCNSLRFREIKNKAIEFGIKDNRIIDIKIFDMPNFDFELYTNLIENPVSIIADDCWGAEVYHALRLTFSSPFVLCYLVAEDYIRMLENFDYYLTQKLVCLQDSDIENSINPIGYLGKERPVKIYFNHATCFSEAVIDWERRIKRINRNNIFIKMTILNEEIAARFQNLPFSNKVGFYSKPSKWKDIYYLPEWRWNDEYMRRYFGYSYSDYVRNSIRNAKTIDYNIYKMLSGEKNFMRKN